MKNRIGAVKIRARKERNERINLDRERVINRENVEGDRGER